METWVAVPGYEGWYEISDHGRVKSLKRMHHGLCTDHRILIPLLYRKGYLKTHFATCGGTRSIKRVFLHRAVYEAFHGPIPDGLTINHKDGNKANNRLDNLEVATMRQQTDHAIANGLRYQTENGERRRTATITDETARAIFRLYDEGRGTRICELSRQFGVRYGTVQRIVYKSRWLHIHH